MRISVQHYQSWKYITLAFQETKGISFPTKKTPKINFSTKPLTESINVFMKSFSAHHMISVYHPLISS